jgi:hypothetical protein
MLVKDSIPQHRIPFLNNSNISNMSKKLQKLLYGIETEMEKIQEEKDKVSKITGILPEELKDDRKHFKAALKRSRFKDALLSSSAPPKNKEVRVNNLANLRQEVADMRDHWNHKKYGIYDRRMSSSESTSRVTSAKAIKLTKKPSNNIYRKTILCQTPGIGFGPTLFRQSPSTAAVMKRTQDEERMRREELDKKYDKRSISDSETVYRVSKPGTDGGLQKCYDEIIRIKTIVEGLQEVKDKLTDTTEDMEEKNRIDEAIVRLSSIRMDNKGKIKKLVQTFEV